MEELIPILIIVIVSILSSVANKNKKSAQQIKQMEARKQAMATEAEHMQEQRAAAAPSAQPAPVIRPTVTAPAPKAAPRAPIAPAPARMGVEGEDACHEYMLDEKRPQVNRPRPQNEDSESAAQELVRGVIIGEILRRPVQKRYGRQA